MHELQLGRVYSLLSSSSVDHHCIVVVSTARSSPPIIVLPIEIALALVLALALTPLVVQLIFLLTSVVSVARCMSTLSIAASLVFIFSFLICVISIITVLQVY
jgi:hypothetical protein